MGVMACRRMGCTNIMCDAYSSDYGYLCHDCLAELKRKGPGTNIKDFINEAKPNPKEEELKQRQWEEYVDMLFPVS